MHQHRVKRIMHEAAWRLSVMGFADLQLERLPWPFSTFIDGTYRVRPATQAR
jgi:hypothetical protein